MAGQGLHILGGQHFGLPAELGLEFGIVDFHVPGSEDQQAAVVAIQGDGFGDAGRVGAQSRGGQFHGGAGHVKLLHVPVPAKGLEVFLDFFDGHEKPLPFTCV